MRRLFIAINLPENIKREIKNIISEIELDADAHWTPPENWHLTLTFLGYQMNESIPEITKSMEQTIEALSREIALEKKIKIEFEKIILAPPHKPSRMIWLVGSKETSKILGEIKNKLEDELVKNGVRFKRENRGYNAHLTLARFQPILRTSDVLNMDVRRPKIENISFTAQSLDLM